MFVSPTKKMCFGHFQTKQMTYAKKNTDKYLFIQAHLDNVICYKKLFFSLAYCQLNRRFVIKHT